MQNWLKRLKWVFFIPVMLASVSIISDCGSFTNNFHIGKKHFLSQWKPCAFSLDNRYELEYSPFYAWQSPILMYMSKIGTKNVLFTFTIFFESPYLFFVASWIQEITKNSKCITSLNTFASVYFQCIASAIILLELSIENFSGVWICSFFTSMPYIHAFLLVVAWSPLTALIGPRV